jgi:branched-chain amino acid transport system ATP-binding protein
MDSQPTAILTVSDVRRDYGGLKAVDGASFSAMPGRITGLIGPNGAGKSTLIGIIGGQIKPTSGSIAFDGHDITGLAPHRIARRGLVRTFQLSAEFIKLTVLENLLVAAPDQKGESLLGAELSRLYWGRSEAANVDAARDVLDRFAMTPKENELAGNLSGGQKRLLEIMRALMTKPKMLLLDEPFAGVNPTLAREIEQYLLDLRDEGLSMIMVEHELAVVERLCEPVVVMAQGKVISEGSMRDVSARQECWMPTSSADGAGRPAPYLQVDDLSAGYGGTVIVNGASATVGPGEIVTIVGPNGAGKSTFLKAIVGMIPAISGRVRLGGEDVTNMRANHLAKRGLGYVPQVNDVFDTLSVLDNLAIGGYLLSRPEATRQTEAVLETFPALKAMLKRTASKLSGGERKMLAIARVLMLEPRLLVLDEPTSNLSAELSRMLLEEHVRRLGKGGTALLIVEQKALAALTISDWAYVMAAGTMKVSSAAKELLARKDIGEVFLGRSTEPATLPTASGGMD